jgi:hypothetical protein
VVRLGSLPLVLVAGSCGGCVRWALPFLVDLVYHVLALPGEEELNMSAAEGPVGDNKGSKKYCSACLMRSYILCCFS